MSVTESDMIAKLFCCLWLVSCMCTGTFSLKGSPALFDCDFRGILDCLN